MEEKRIDGNEVARQILDAYFTFRSPLPREGYVQQNRSTREVIDDLSDMYAFSAEEVCGYMAENGYAPTTEQDGSVRWAVWRTL